MNDRPAAAVGMVEAPQTWSPPDAVREALDDPRHEAVGGAAALMGPWQVDALRAIGTLPHHRVLDLGCGTLRGGLCVASYLAPNRYVGVDPNPALLGVARELASIALAWREVELLRLEDTPCDARFDRVLTQSVLNHLDGPGIERTVMRAAGALRPSGCWLGTIRFGDADGVVVAAVHPTRPREWISNRVSPAWFSACMSRHGLAMLRLPDLVHPRGLDMFIAYPHAEAAALCHLDTLMRLDTSAPGPKAESAVAHLAETLGCLHFVVEVIRRVGAAPVIVARRAATGGGRGRVVIYNHYDAVAQESAWHERDGRLFGSGVADNKGPLALRLAAFERTPRTPEIVWLIQGEEESGSQLAREVFGELMRSERADLHVDESGWFDADGTQRILACRQGSHGEPKVPDAWLADLVRHVQRAAPTPVRAEIRRLDKRFVPGGCAFHGALPEGARYLSIGPLDGVTRIHHPSESLARRSIEPAIAQFVDLLMAVAS